MNTRIVFTLPESTHPDAKLRFHTIPADMFNPNSLTRKHLKDSNRQPIILSNDNEVIEWVVTRLKTLNILPEGVQHYLVPSENFPLSAELRMDWYYDEASNSVKAP